jgi:hypothetical protein
MYLQKEIKKTSKKHLFFVDILKATGRKEQDPETDPVSNYVVRILGTGYVPECHESTTLHIGIFNFFIRSESVLAPAPI